ncbi:MAG: hypothetical protein ACOYIR_03525 [Christensenellales bacterium]|jgi:hypothetical protein
MKLNVISFVIKTAQNKRRESKPDLAELRATLQKKEKITREARELAARRQLY